MNDKQFERTKAIAVLECMAIDLTGALAESSKTSPMTEVLEQRLEAIDTAQAALREQPRWIPVDERLPEQTDPATFVLFIITQGMQHVGTYFKGGSTSQFDGFYSCAVRYEVTHWMPLPEPPREG